MPALITGVAVILPLFYLLIRAFEGEWSVSADLLWRQRNLMLLVNTLTLAAGVLAVTTLIAFPLAWLTTRSDLPGRRLFTLLGVLPLAIPGYVLAYALLGLGGVNGTFALVTGIVIPRPGGYWGSLIAISLYTFPYLYLNLRSGLMGLDPSTEEAARSLGSSNSTILFGVVIPQLKPAFYAGMLIIGLYVLGDFGAVSLMRFETFSYALYLQYAASYDRIYAAWIALMLLTLTCSILFAEYRLLRGLLFYRTGSGTSRKFVPVKLGRWKWAAWLFVFLLALSALVVPVSTVVFWMMRGFDPVIWTGLGEALRASFIASAPAALLAAMMAVPLAYISVRFPSKTTNALHRTAYLGYATPPLALALALIFFTLNTAPFLYQTLILLIVAYALHFMAEAIGPIRSSLYQASPRLEEAARSMGFGPVRAFMHSTFPLLRNGLMVGAAFVFLSSMKELPITFLLSPVGFETLAINVWSYSNEAMFAEAAPFALTILIFSVFFVGLLFAKEWNRT